MTFDAATLDVPLASAETLAADLWSEAWTLPPPLLVSEWAEAYRHLPEEGAAEPGAWRNERTPFLVEIMDCLSVQHPCERVVFQKSIQTGGTEVLINALGYIMCHEPGPTMLLVPGIDMANRHSKQRIAPSIAASPEWSRHVRPARSRESGNTTLVKEFDGGILVIATANSATALRSMPVRYLLADEVDKYVRNLDGEGNALTLAEGRTNTFQGRRKIFLCSSPTLVGQSLIHDEYEASDQREYHVPCPHCGQLQVLVIDQLMPDGTYLCIENGCTIQESYKTQMLAWGRWIAKYPERTTPGFHINALYAPYRLGDSWKTIADKREEARRDPEKLVTFTNMVLGLAFENERTRVDADAIKERAELGWKRGTVPRGGLVLTMGVDCQHDRFAIKTMAWGRGERGCVVDYEEVPGDPTKPGEGYIELDRYLQRPCANYRGALMLARAVAIDGGNWTEDVAKFVRARQRRVVKVGGMHREQAVLLVRGRSHTSDRVVYRPKKTEVNTRGRSLARSVGTWGVGTDIAKNTLFGRIAADASREDPEERMIRFPGGRHEGDEQRLMGALPDSYYQGLTSEYFDLRTQRWVHDRALRNEPVDTLVYSYFAALSPFVRIDLMRDHEWDMLEHQLQSAGVDLFSALAERLDSRETFQAPMEVSARDALALLVARYDQHAMRPVPAAELTAWHTASTSDPKGIGADVLGVCLAQLDDPAAPIGALLDSALIQRARAELQLAEVVGMDSRETPAAVPVSVPRDSRETSAVLSRPAIRDSRGTKNAQRSSWGGAHDTGRGWGDG